MGSLEKFTTRLFENQNERDEFLQAVKAAQSGERVLVWTRERPETLPFTVVRSEPWLPDCVDIVGTSGQEAGTHHLHAEGAYYVMDLSSVFEARPLFNLIDSHPGIETVCDVCASPGGKSVLMSQALSPQLLIANERIGKRLPALIANLKRCAIAPSVVTCADSRFLGLTLEHSCDVVVVDAPCSGQSLGLKGSASSVRSSRGAFHPTVINSCSNRQKRILASSAPLVAGAGYLLYMTCTFSREENEQVIQWLLQKFPSFTPVPCKALEAFQSPFVNFPCYRAWPQHGMGAGGFTCLLRCDDNLPRTRASIDGLRVCWKQDRLSFPAARTEQLNAFHH